jgi:hypothetical protein
LAKRFTDTGKWDKAWFRQLRPRGKTIWSFLCDRCDHAGIWEIDLEAMSFFVNDEWAVSLDEIQEIFGDRIEVVGSKLVVTGFVEFQYGDLNPENRAHKSVISRLERLAPKKGLIRSFQGRKDKDKDKDKDKVKEGECEGIYAAYPRKKGKSVGLKKLRAEIKAGAKPDDIAKALANFLANLRKEKTEGDFIPYFSTWMNEWRDWLDPEHGKSESFAESGAVDFLAIAQGGKP